jgi:putative oxidoreductase
MKTSFLIGRLLFGGYFLYNGINHFREANKLAQYAASKNIPQPKAAVVASGVALTVGGASILLGVKPKLGAAALIGFLLGVSPLMHNFWKAEDPQQRMNDEIQFFKNLALLGGAVALAAVEEPWPASVPIAQPKTIKGIWKSVRREIAA